MVIWEGMQMRRASYGVFVFLLCALVIGASEGVRRTKETFYGGDWVAHEDEIDEDMVCKIDILFSFFIYLCAAIFLHFINIGVDYEFEG